MAALTRRLESDLQLSSAASPTAAAPTPAASQLRGSFDGFGSLLHSAGSTLRTGGGAGAAASMSKQQQPAQPSRLSGQRQQAQQPGYLASSQQQAVGSSSGLGQHSSGTFATPASSLLQRSGSMDSQQALPPHSAASTAAGGMASLRRDSFASVDGTPDRQASLGAALRQLQTATEKGASRWVGGGEVGWACGGSGGVRLSLYGSRS